ncbi:MAG TPA: ROK family protein, partial [Acidimicrobiales bacterium]|nr:ROK family protein [Acidimicrobiales bacterium]
LDESGALQAERSVNAPSTADDLLEAVVDAAGHLCGGRPPVAVGIGIPGLVDATGTVRIAPNLRGITGAPLSQPLAERFPSSRCWVGNDATAACWAEHSIGSAAGSEEVLLVTLGTGIGGGIVSGGRLAEGVHRFAGEIGHMVIDPDGPDCPCGKRGCWERFASGEALGGFGREAAARGEAERVLELCGGNIASLRGEHVTAAALEGDKGAVVIMDGYSWWVALGLANLANALDPELIVIGGGLVSAGDSLLGPVRRWFAEMVEAPEARERTRIVLAALGHRAGAIGAGLLANDGGGQEPVR